MVYKSSSPTKDGRCWQFRAWYTDHHGARKQFNSKKFETKKEAQREEAKFMTSQKIYSKSLTFGEVSQLFLEYATNYARENTINAYTTSIRAWSKFNDIKIDELNVAHFQEFIKDHINYTPLTINTYIRATKLVMKFADETLGINTSRQIKFLKCVKEEKEQQEELKYYSMSQFECIVRDGRFPELYTTLFYMGLRFGEARGLQWNDIDFEKNTISIIKQISATQRKLSLPKATKTKTSTRTLPMFSQVHNVLKSLYDKQSKKEDFSKNWYVFCDELPIDTNMIKKDLDKVCAKNGFHSLGSHAFRHSCASHLLSNGASIYLVSKFLGHSSVDITSRVYAHLLPNTLTELVAFVEKNGSLDS